MTALDQIPYALTQATPADFRRLAEACDRLAQANTHMANAYREAAQLVEERQAPIVTHATAVALTRSDRYRAAGSHGPWLHVAEVTRLDDGRMWVTDGHGRTHHHRSHDPVEIIAPTTDELLANVVGAIADAKTNGGS